MRKLVLAATLVSLLTPLTAAVAQPDNRRDTRADRRDDRQDDRADRRDDRRDDRQDNRANRRDDRRDNRQAGTRGYRQQDYRRYDYNRPDQRYGNYRAERYYSTGSQYRPRVLSRNDRIYRGQDNRYYCRRDDGTTGLIVGGLAGGLLGNTIAPGGSKTLGALLGGGAGALLGQSIGRDGGVNCR